MLKTDQNRFTSKRLSQKIPASSNHRHQPHNDYRLSEYTSNTTNNNKHMRRDQPTLISRHERYASSMSKSNNHSNQQSGKKLNIVNQQNNQNNKNQQQQFNNNKSKRELAAAGQYLIDWGNRQSGDDGNRHRHNNSNDQQQAYNSNKLIMNRHNENAIRSLSAHQTTQQYKPQSRPQLQSILSSTSPNNLNSSISTTPVSNAFKNTFVVSSYNKQKNDANIRKAIVSMSPQPRISPGVSGACNVQQSFNGIDKGTGNNRNMSPSYNHSPFLQKSFNNESQKSINSSKVFSSNNTSHNQPELRPTSSPFNNANCNNSSHWKITTHQQPLPSSDLQALKHYLLTSLNQKVKAFHLKSKQQDQKINSLSQKIKDQQQQINAKDQVIKQLYEQKKSSKTLNTVSLNSSSNSSISISKPSASSVLQKQSYLSRKISDQQIKFKIIQDCCVKEKEVALTQKNLDHKIDILTTYLINNMYARLRQSQACVDNFIRQKSQTLKELGAQIQGLDNKLIGRSQALKETLVSLRAEVQKLESDSFTRDTNRSQEISQNYKSTYQSDLSLGATTSSNRNVRLYNNKLKDIVKEKQQSVKSSKSKEKSNSRQKQKSMNFSLTSVNEYGQSEIISSGHTQGNQLDDTFNRKCDISSLTDEFFYPGSCSRGFIGTNVNEGGVGSASRIAVHITQDTPIKYLEESSLEKPSSSTSTSNRQKHQSTIENQKLLKSNKNTNNLSNLEIRIREQTNQQSNKNSSSFSSIIKKEMSRPNEQNQNKIESENDQKVMVKIDNKTIKRKIEAIKFLIEQKRKNCEESFSEPLRCFVDKSGYLKYTDSRTFVFDGKGSLISCTQGQFWFLVTKGLIEGQQDQSISYEVL